MPSCTLHIGMHKTGSTSIQYSLQHFKDPRFTYAELGGDPNHSHAIYDAFTEDAERGFFDLKPTQEQVDLYRDLLRKAISCNGERNLIISGEKMSSMHPEALLRLRNFLVEHFSQIRVVGYVRTPASYIASAFQQRLKNRSPTFEPLRLYRSYKETFKKFDDIFGEESVSLFKFDPKILLNHCAVSDFCNRVGIYLPADRIRNENESMSRQFVGLLYVYRKFAPEQAATLQLSEVDRLNKALSTVWNTRFVLSPTLAQCIRDHHAADIAWMENRLGESLKETAKAAGRLAINSEADLIQTEPATVDRLRALVGSRLSRQYRSNSPQHVAQLFHALRASVFEPVRSTSWDRCKLKLQNLFRR